MLVPITGVVGAVDLVAALVPQLGVLVVWWPEATLEGFHGGVHTLLHSAAPCRLPFVPSSLWWLHDAVVQSHALADV